MAYLKSQWSVFGIGGVLLSFLYLNIFRWHLSVVGIVLTLGYLFLLTYLWQRILEHVFRFERGFVTVFLACFAALFVVSGIESIVITFYTTTYLLTFISLTTSLVLSFFLNIWVHGQSHGPGIEGKGRKEYLIVFPHMKWISWVYILLWSVTVWLFFHTYGTLVFFSPWQSLSVFILPLVAVLSILLGILLCSKTVTKHVLLFVLMQSVLLHMYMPLSHMLPWGGDVWRHIAVEEQLSSGEIVPPVLFGPEALWREVVGVDIPEVFLIPQKYSYGQFWGLAVIIRQLTNISLEAINIWMIPLLWSLVFPLLLFRFGRLVFQSWRGGLLLAWLSTIAFSLQALGALSLPVSLGVLTFFFMCMLLLQYGARRHPPQRYILMFFGVLMLFGYALSFLLLVFVVGGAWIFSTIHARVQHTVYAWALIILVTIVGALIFPGIELLAHTSLLPSHVDILQVAKTAFGQLSGWYYASVIRPHDILSGNVIFNHTPTYAFVASIFTVWRWWLLPWMMFFLGMMVYGLIQYVCEKKQGIALVPVWTILSLMGAYKIGWFLLEGDRTLIRRLDPYVATGMLVFFSFGILLFFSFIRYKSLVLRRVCISIFVLMIGWVGTATYASGPDIRSTSTDEYDVASFLAGRMKDTTEPSCVLADTWVLLPLEALSHGQVVGGNFPIGSQFGQAQRVSLYDTVREGDIMSDTIPSIFTLTHATHCFLVFPDTMTEDRRERISLLLDTVPIQYPGFLIWDIRQSDLYPRTF